MSPRTGLKRIDTTAIAQRLIRPCERGTRPITIGEKRLGDALQGDRFAESRYQAAKQADQDLRRDEPWLWHFANVVTRAIHPWVSLRVWWLGRAVWLPARGRFPLGVA